MTGVELSLIIGRVEGESIPKLTNVRIGLRAHDVHQGLLDAPADRNSGVLATELEATQLAGMAGALAAWLKGHEVVEEAHELRILCSQQLDISPFVFDRVVGLLEQRGLVWDVKRDGDRVVAFNESVPGGYEEIFGQIGDAWRDRRPTEIEEGLLAVVDELSTGPTPVAAFGMETQTVDRILEVGGYAEAIRVIELQGERVAYTPFLAYEHPETIAAALAEIDLGELRSGLSSIRQYQGTPLSKSPLGGVLTSLVGVGLVAAPALQRPDQSTETFAVAPYGIAAEYRGLAKPILDKALAIVAAVRMGEHFGGITSLFNPVALLRKLLTGQTTAPHSSTERQYSVLHSLGIVRFQPGKPFTSITMIPTDDNRTAVQLAIDLLEEGEATQSRLLRPGGGGSLLTPGRYRSPIQTTRQARTKVEVDAGTLREAIEAAMGRHLVD